LYNFEALDSNTLSVNEGEKMKIVQRHDDNLNNEWWLVEKGDSKKVGYVPSNYIELLSDRMLGSMFKDNDNLEFSTNSNDSDINATAII
jgi:hypothetical protein